MEIVPRILQGLKQEVAYSNESEIVIIQPNINSSESDGFCCEECQKLQNICKNKNRVCVEYYAGSKNSSNKLNAIYWSEASKVFGKFTTERLNGNRPLLCSTYHLNGLDEKEDESRKKRMEFFESLYKKHLEDNQEIIQKLEDRE